MRLFRCCCRWSFVIGRKQVYGPIYPIGIGTFPRALSNTQTMRTRDEWADSYADCAACYDGKHHHPSDPGPWRA